MLYYEFCETGVAEKLNYESPADVRSNYPKFFWSAVRPYLDDAIKYLSITQEGKSWIAMLHSHVFSVEHKQFSFGPFQG